MDELPSRSRDVTFPRGLPGFAHLRQFRLVIDPDYSPPFEFLESVEDPDVGFFLIDPTLLVADYSPEIPAVEIQDLRTEDEDAIEVRAIVTIGQDADSTTANLAAPVLMNFEFGLGCQAILEDGRYSVHTPLIRAE
jgi:flagellar assembly factor FliW